MITFFSSVLLLLALICTSEQTDVCSGPACNTEGEDATSTDVLTELQTGQKNLEKQIATLYQHMSSLLTATNSQLSATNSQLSASNGQMITQLKHLEVVEKSLTQRLDDLEKKVLSSQNTLTALSTKTTSMETDVMTKLTDSQKSLGDLSSKMAAIEATQGMVKSEITDVKTKLTKQHETLGGLSSTMTAMETKQGMVKTEVAGVLTKVTDSHNKQQKSLDYHTEKLNGLSRCACPKELLYVRHPATRYQFTFEQAKAACREKGGELASLADLEEAQKKGMDQCACGWLNDGSMRYPMQKQRSGCGPRGINICTYYSKGDAYCLIKHDLIYTVNTKA